LAGIYNVRAKARCSLHPEVESGWSPSLQVTIISGGSTNYKVLPEVIWASATGGGEWVTEVQITDMTGGSRVQVYFNYGGGQRRGPLTLWTNSGGAGTSAKYTNLLSTLQSLDSSFSYYGKVGAVEFVTQDTAHRIHVVARTLNGNYSKTFPGLNDDSSNTADLFNPMMVQNTVSNATYRTFIGCFNPSTDSVTVEFRIYGSNGIQIGNTITKTFVAKDFQSFNLFTAAGVPYPTYSYDNTWVEVRPVSGAGRVMVFGATANNNTNDPAAHIAVPGQDFVNCPASYKVLPEVIWASATGGGEWVTEVQITDMTGGSGVQVYFNYGGGQRRGPLTLWTNSGGAGTSAKYTNLLSTLQSLDSSFSYYGKVGAVEFVTQDTAHRIHVVARTLNGNYSKTFPGLNDEISNTADLFNPMMVQNTVSNATYRTFIGCFNPSTDSVTVEFRIYGSNGIQIGNTITKTFVAKDFQSFNLFTAAGVPYPTYSYDNTWVEVRPVSGAGRVMVFGATANNNTNDPAAHIAVPGR
jgi:inosine/xanthosine triphosphate pyrophosphatase family protein